MIWAIVVVRTRQSNRNKKSTVVIPLKSTHSVNVSVPFSPWPRSSGPASPPSLVCAPSLGCGSVSEVPCACSVVCADLVDPVRRDATSAALFRVFGFSSCCSVAARRTSPLEGGLFLELYSLFRSRIRLLSFTRPSTSSPLLRIRWWIGKRMATEWKKKQDVTQNAPDYDLISWSIQRQGKNQGIFKLNASSKSNMFRLWGHHTVQSNKTASKWKSLWSHFLVNSKSGKESRDFQIEYLFKEQHIFCLWLHHTVKSNKIGYYQFLTTCSRLFEIKLLSRWLSRFQ